MMAGKSETDASFWKKIREKSRKHEKTWENARFVLADVPLSYDEVLKILPWGMKPSDPPMATLFIADYPRVSFPIVPYHEAAMLVHVKTPLGPGIHCCWMIVDDDTALILGREMLGYPKKFGDFEFDERDDTIHASISRRGVRVMDITAKRGMPQEPKPPVFDIKTFNVGAMGQLFVFNPIWLFRPREIIHESFQADIKLTLRESCFDPLSSLITGEPVNGRIVLMDITGDSPYMAPVGVAGPGWFGRTFDMRFR
jgi:acetoacetate decarboxylase